MSLKNTLRQPWLHLGLAAATLSLLGWLSPAGAAINPTSVNYILTGTGSEDGTGLISNTLTVQYQAETAGNYIPIVTATLPSGVSLVKNSSDSDCGTVGQLLTCILPKLTYPSPTLESYPVVLQASDPSATIAVTYNIPVGQNETNPNDNTVTLTTTGQVIDLSLAGSGSMDASHLVTDSLTLKNAGPQQATSVTVKGTLPSGTTFVSTGSTSICTASGQVVTCNVGTLNANGSKALTVMSQAPTTASTLNVTFTAASASSLTDVNPANNSVTVTSAMVDDLSLTGSGTETSAGLATDTLTLGNAGPGPASSTVVTTSLPTGTTFVAASSSSNCTSSWPTVTCSVGNLAASGTTTVKVAAQAPATRLSLALTFNASSAQSDTNSSNNSVTVTTQNTSLVDLALSGSGTETTAGLVTDSLTLTNNGPATATAVTVTTTLPGGVSFVSGSSSSGCSASWPTVTCTVANLAANASTSLNVAAQASDASSAVPLTFTAQAAQGDYASANNSVTITTSGLQSDLVLSGIGGETLTGLATDNLTVANDGPGANTGVVITGTLPTGASFVSGSSSSFCAASGLKVTCTVGNLADNASAAVKVVIQAPASQSTLSVPFAVTGTLTDPDTSNNSVTVTTSTTYLSYQYDGNGFISKRTSTGGSSAYLLYSKSGQLIGEYDSSGTAKRENIYMGHALVAYSNAGKTTDGNCTPSGTTTPTYTVTDPLGSAVAGSDACGGMMWTQPYYPYGKRQAYPALGQNDQWFTGKYSDDLTQLVDMGARQYSPAFGRFMSIDPASVSPANIHSFNRYEYANNNPYRYVDPSGNSPSPADLISFAVDVGSLLIDEGIYVAAEANGNDAVANLAIESIEGERFDAAASTFGVIDPIPGSGQAVKAAHAAEESEKAAKVVHVLKDGEGASAADMAASVGGATAGSRSGQSKIRQKLIDKADAKGEPYKCWRCGQESTNPADMHLGHRNVPTSKGGNLSDANVCLEGAACNLSAGNRGAPSEGMSCAERGSCGAPYGR